MEDATFSRNFSTGIPGLWSGLKYLENVSIIGGLSFVLLFILVKLRDDHHLPHPVHIIRKLIAVWHTTDDQVATLCGVDSADYLALVRMAAVYFFLLAIPGLLLIVPINMVFGTVAVNDQLISASVSHLPSTSPWLWFHVAFTLVICGCIDYFLQNFEADLQSTRYQRIESVESISAFTVMIRGVPRGLARDKLPLVEYFEHLYPGKIYTVIVPFDLVLFQKNNERLNQLHKQLAYAKIMAETEASREKSLLSNEFSLENLETEEHHFYEPIFDSLQSSVSPLETENMNGSSRFFQGNSLFQNLTIPSFNIFDHFKKNNKPKWQRMFWLCQGWTWKDEIGYLRAKIIESEDIRQGFCEGSARGSGIAFIVFKDFFTATRALHDASWKLPEALKLPHLATHRWQGERAPPPKKVKWHNMGYGSMARKVRGFLVNCSVFAALFFWSSPLAMATALSTASARIDPESALHLNAWISWAKVKILILFRLCYLVLPFILCCVCSAIAAQSSSPVVAFLLQFLPNLLTFFTMYFFIPAGLSRLSAFECHLTVSGEQRTILAKMIYFFLLNFFLLKATVETTLESAILHFGECYSHPSNCPATKRLVSQTFVGSSSTSVLAFLITSAVFGVSLDLLSPVWTITRRIRGLRDRLASLSLQFPYQRESNPNLAQVQPGQSQDMVEFPPESMETSELELKPPEFDFPQHIAYNLTAFAMTLFYSSAAPLVLPAGALFFWYRFCVDKYNFLFMYRSSATTTTTDGRLMETVLSFMRAMLCFHMAFQASFFFFRGDNEKLQSFLCFLVLIVLLVKYGTEKLSGVAQTKRLDGHFAQNLRSVEQYLIDGQTGYETMSKTL